METALASIGVVVLLIASFPVIGWLIVVALTLVMFACAEHEKTLWCGLITGVVAFFIYALTGFNIPLETFRHPLYAGLSFIGYLMVGALWSVFKFDRLIDKSFSKLAAKKTEFISNCKQGLENAKLEGKNAERTWPGPLQDVAGTQRQEVKQKLLAQFNEGKIPDEYLGLWNISCAQSNYFQPLNEKPTPLKNKSRITTWMAFWPWSVADYFLFKLVKDLLDAIWRRLVGVYQRIIDRHYKDFDERLLKNEND